MGTVKEFGFASENLDAKEYLATAKLAEELGYGTYWLPEDYFYRGPFVVASAIACSPSGIDSNGIRCA